LEHQVAIAATPRTLAEQDRFRGNHGTIINPHRAIATLPLRGADVVLAIVLGLGGATAYLFALDFVGRAWTWTFQQLAAPLGFAGVSTRAFRVGSVVAFQLPYFDAVARAPTREQWWIGLLVTVVVLLVSFLFRQAFLPLGYALRLAVVVQATALVFFWHEPWPFPYDLASYVTTMEIGGLTAIGLVPVVLGLTFYVIDARVRQKVGLTLAIAGHLAVFVPLQYALQSYAIAHASLLVMPLCFALFALLPEVMIFIALYGWGMSWPSRRRRGRRE
jgi:hypothetical protein